MSKDVFLSLLPSSPVLVSNLQPDKSSKMQKTLSLKIVTGEFGGFFCLFNRAWEWGEAKAGDVCNGSKPVCI